MMDKTEDSEQLLDNEETFQNDAGFTKRRLCIVPICALYFFGYGILMYAVPEYIQSRVAEAVKSDWHGRPETPGTDPGGDTKFNPCNSNESSPEYKLHTEIQQESAKWLIYVALCSYIPPLATNLILGSYSDIKGRKLVFGICTVGNTLRCVIVTFVVYFKANLLFLLLGQLLDGVTGSFTVYFAVSYSYLSDITKPDRSRTVAIVLFDLVLGLTISVSSFASGYFIRAEGFMYPMLTATILTAVASICTLIFLPETLPRRGLSENNSCIENVKRSVKFYISSESQGRLKTCKYILLLLCFTFVAIPNMNRLTMETLYQLGRPFCWDPSKIGWFGTVKITCMSIFGIGAVFILKKCFKDDSIAAIACVFGIASFIVEGLATTDVVLYTVPLIASTTFLPIPMVRSMMSSITSAADQGALFAGIGAVETMCSLLGALTNNLVYSATMSIMNGFVFLVCAMANFVGLVFLIAYMFVSRRNQEFVVMEEIEYDPPDQSPIVS